MANSENKFTSLILNDSVFIDVFTKDVKIFNALRAKHRKAVKKFGDIIYFELSPYPLLINVFLDKEEKKEKGKTKEG